MKEGVVLVTGATGKLGTAVCRALLARGHTVRASDRQFVKGFPIKVELGDLCDEHFAHRVVEGVSAVVHAGNHPNPFAPCSPQQLLGDNVRMNANVFHSAANLGVRSIVFASSVQVMIRRDRPVEDPPFALPYLPLDSHVPTDPGSNTYAQSKEFGERMLELLGNADPGLSLTAIRFPMLITDWQLRRMHSLRRVPLHWTDLPECTAHLFFDDASRLVVDVLERELPGFRRYFPARSMDLKNYPVEELLRECYPNVALRGPIANSASLIDISAITREVGWEPRERLSIEVER